jgi:putative ABC transport system ATP-binding protein
VTAPALAARGLVRRYAGGVEAVAGIDVEVGQGEFVAIVGPSGSGKTTLLHLLGTLERPSEGALRVCGVAVDRLSDAELAGLRARRLGFVFQRFFLLDGMCAEDNVALGLLYSGTPSSERRSRAQAALRKVGLGHRLGQSPAQLSGGEQQRVAIARALVARPDIIFADEPSGNLDSAAGAEVLSLLRGLNEEGHTVVLVTHDSGLAAAAERRVALKDGQVESDAVRV